MLHFHICWSESKLDWEAFETREDALTQAQELVRPGETYVVQQFDGDCPRCHHLRDTSSFLHRENARTKG